MIRDADNDATDEIERHDDQRRDRVALDEFSGAIHCTVEIGLALHGRALSASALGIKCAGVHVGIDRHLLTRHGIECKARGDLGDTLRPARDNDELNRDQDRKNDESYDQVPMHDERAERGNDRTHCARRCTLREDEPRRRDVERKTKERCDQQRRCECRKLERVFDRHRQQQHQRRTENVDTEQHIEKRGRQGYDEDPHDREQHSGKGIDRDARHVRGRSPSAPLRISDATTSATAT